MKWEFCSCGFPVSLISEFSVCPNSPHWEYRILSPSLAFVESLCPLAGFFSDLRTFDEDVLLWSQEMLWRKSQAEKINLGRDWNL